MADALPDELQRRCAVLSADMSQPIIDDRYTEPTDAPPHVNDNRAWDLTANS